MKNTVNPSSANGRVGAAWAKLDPRERRLVGGAMLVVLLALIWWLALAPALSTLRTAGLQRQALDMQVQQMQRLQAEAETLKAMPKLGQSDALRALETAVKQRLGSGGQLNVVGDRANITLKDVPAAALAEYLADARANARAAPVEARLSRTPGAAPGTPARWNGTLSLSLPQP